mmetsp:Transcript_18089/g.51514  ORF Transcript_18089/g.51514 Transcript_18089/m.51514 type:complete len:206 (+) Transcript_18089:155-772(+)
MTCDAASVNGESSPLIFSMSRIEAPMLSLIVFITLRLPLASAWTESTSSTERNASSSKSPATSICTSGSKGYSAALRPSNNSSFDNLPSPLVSKARNVFRNCRTSSDDWPTFPEICSAIRFNSIRSNLLSLGYIRMFMTTLSWFRKSVVRSSCSVTQSCSNTSDIAILASAGQTSILSASSIADAGCPPKSSRRHAGVPSCGSSR